MTADRFCGFTSASEKWDRPSESSCLSLGTGLRDDLLGIVGDNPKLLECRVGEKANFARSSELSKEEDMSCDSVSPSSNSCLGSKQIPLDISFTAVLI